MSATTDTAPVATARATMKAVVRDRYGAPREVLELREMEKPEVDEDSVLVRVRASSVNPAEWYGTTGPLMVRAMTGLRKPKESRVGADFAGVVEAVGENVAHVQPGDEVFGGRTGAFAEYVSVKEGVVRKPANVSFEQAGSVAIAGTTALQGLRDKGALKGGQKVLINGASGGVGTFSVQIARALGADVTAVCSTRNAEQTSALGADRVIDYTREDFTRSGERYDLILDNAGSRHWSELKRVLKPDGTVVIVGAPKGGRVLGPLRHIAAMRLASIAGSQNAVFFVAKINRADLQTLADLMEEGKLSPVVERTYPLTEIADALDHLGEGHARGKIVVTV